MLAIWAVCAGSWNGVLLDRVSFRAYITAVGTLPSAGRSIGIARPRSVTSVALISLGQVQNVSEASFARLLIFLSVLALRARPAVHI